ncbi:MAG: acyl-CoA dehydrogenase family protein [Streptosporangiaceae bacterium]
MGQEHDALRDAVRTLAEKEIQPHAGRRRRRRTLPGRSA